MCKSLQYVTLDKSTSQMRQIQFIACQLNSKRSQPWSWSMSWKSLLLGKPETARCKSVHGNPGDIWKRFSDDWEMAAIWISSMQFKRTCSHFLQTAWHSTSSIMRSYNLRPLIQKLCILSLTITTNMPVSKSNHIYPKCSGQKAL